MNEGSSILRMGLYLANPAICVKKGLGEQSVPEKQQQIKAYANIIQARAGFYPSWKPDTAL